MTILRNSERKDWLRCRQKWQWAWVERMTAKTTSSPLTFGTLIHAALELRYPPGLKRGPHPCICWEAVWADNEEEIYGVWSDDGYGDAYDLGLEMMYNYWRQYGDDPQWEIIQPEMALQVEVERDDGTSFIQAGQMDAVVRDLRTDRVGMWENKTTSRGTADYWLPMDEQAGTYFTFGTMFLRDLGVLHEGQQLDFSIYNFLSKQKADLRKKNELGQSLNKDGTVSKIQPAPLFYRELVMRSVADQQALYDRIVLQEAEMEMARQGQLAIYKNANGNCKWDCQFKDMCELHEHGADWESFRDAMFTSWDPYEAHELEKERASG